MKTGFRVLYRTGGKLNFVWKRIYDVYFTKADAKAKADEIERLGYKTLIVSGETLEERGMPVSWSGE